MGLLDAFSRKKKVPAEKKQVSFNKYGTGLSLDGTTEIVTHHDVATDLTTVRDVRSGTQVVYTGDGRIYTTGVGGKITLSNEWPKTDTWEEEYEREWRANQDRYEQEKIKALEAERYDQLRRMVEMAEMQQRQDATRKMESYTDAEGRRFLRPVEEKPPPKQVHKAGHFPIDWMVAAHKRAQESDYLIRIEITGTGVDLTAINGDDYCDHKVAWLAMEKADLNPLILAIEHVERQIRVQSKLKAANG